MKYDCGHDGCDICGGRNCNRDKDLFRVRYDNAVYLVCDDCQRWAVHFVYKAACHLGGTIIDSQKPCARRSSLIQDRAEEHFAETGKWPGETK